MQPTSTQKICDNFGHNFYRKKGSGSQPDVIKCKHCKIIITMNSSGDYEEMRSTNQLVHNLMKRLFLLRQRRDLQFGN
jgi:hypothetical protein